MTFDEQVHTRRNVVIAGAGAVAAAAALAACATDAKDDASPAADPAPDGRSAAADVLAKTTDIPVGGGVILGDTVVTQPTAGAFVGLSAICTHAGCKVVRVSGGTVDCACHGSKFHLDGSVANGPAASPLAARSIRVEGDSIIAG
ncbi:QcrA and Rieske domain-containing protein [Nocardia pneumoniae]|uniref:QcrA and Rieske domain-containing protein n=1 Tax=Nocardia pneumoniae TaxID=228601 RepID=UPI00031F79E0|nr:Rieske (2Fe-2S) protein [Nocardia pneumoniae]